MRAYKTIFVGIDFSAQDDLSVRAAGELARCLRAERIHLAHVASLYPAWAIDSVDISGAAFASAFQAGLDGAKAALERVQAPVNLRVTREVRTGAVARELADAASAVKADLVIVGSHPRGRVGRLVLGSVASTLVRAAPCPVLVVGPDRPLVTPVRTVLAAIDTSAVSTEVVEHAAAFAMPAEGSVRVLSGFDLHRSLRHIAERRGMALAELIETCESRYRSEIQAIVDRASVAGVATIVDVRTHDDPKTMIMETIGATHPDLIAIGTSGHNAWERFFLGATASHILTEAPCPVLVVPTTGSS